MVTAALRFGTGGDENGPLSNAPYRWTIESRKFHVSYAIAALIFKGTGLAGVVSAIAALPAAGLGGRGCCESSARTQVPDVLEQPVRGGLFVQIRERRIGKCGENVIEDQAFHLGLRLFLFGPAVHSFDYVPKPDQQVAAFALDPLAVGLTQVGTRDQVEERQF